MGGSNWAVVGVGRRGARMRRGVHVLLLIAAVFSLGRCDRAGDEGDGSASSAGVPNRDELEAAALNQQVRALVAAGSMSEAHTVAVRACEMDRRLYGPTHKYVAQSLNNLGYLEMQIGRLEDARDHFEEAARIQAVALGPTHVEYARTLDNIGQLLRTLGRSFDAEYFHRESLSIREKSLPANDKDVIEGVSNLGLSLTAQGRYQEALPYVQRVYEHDRARGTDRERAHSSNALGYVMLQLYELERARPLLEEAIRKRAALGMQYEAAQAETNLALLEHRAGNKEAAVRLLDRAAPVLSATYGESHPALGGVRTQLGRALRLTGDNGRAVGELLRGRSVLTSRVAGARGDEVARAQFGESLHAQENMGELCMVRLSGSKPEEGLREVEQARASALTELLGQGTASLEPADAKKLSEALHANEAFLSIQWSSAAVTAILVVDDNPEASGFILAPDFRDVRLLERKVAEFAMSIRKPTRSETSAEEVRSALFPESLLGRIERPGIERVIVVADGPLSQVPMDLLIGAPEVAYAPSGSIFVHLRELVRGRESTLGSRRLLAVGPPDYSGWAKWRERLQGASQGAEAMAAIQMQLHTSLAPIKVANNTGLCKVASARGCEVMLLEGRQATLAGVERAIQDRDIIHLLAHGRSGARNAAYAASLALSAPSSMKEEDYGFLTLERLVKGWRGKLRACDLVVLAACETQVSVPIGTNQFALPWGFLSAGCPSVIATLWSVDAEATNLLLSRFYENFLGAHADERSVRGVRLAPATAAKKATALAEAREWLRVGAKPSGGNVQALGRERPVQTKPSSFSDPYYWAGFVLVGEPE